jgi:Flp pilus assembly pilin Flp
MKQLLLEEGGQDLVEYGLLIVLVALATIGAMKNLATAISSVFSAAASNLTSASS